jgi:hypothetical protein
MTIETLHQLIMQMFADRDKLADERLANQQNALLVAINAQDKQTQQALTAADRAVVKAEAATEKRFEGVNEFRQALSDQSSTFVTRIESDAVIKTINEKIDAISERQNKAEGRGGGMGAMWGYLLAAISTIIAVVMFVSNMSKR